MVSLFLKIIIKYIIKFENLLQTAALNGLAEVAEKIVFKMCAEKKEKISDVISSSFPVAAREGHLHLIKS